MNKQKTAIALITISVIILAIVTAIALSSPSKIANIKDEDYVGKTVSVRGTVQSTIKIGSLSGYTLEDGTGKISVSSQKLPKEGDTITARGILMHDTLFGYYIKAD